MLKTLISCCVCATMILGGSMQTKNINQCICESAKAQVIINGEYAEIENINQLNNILNNMLNNSHVLPALGVSIHHEILSALQSGVWLKLQYNGTQTVDDMPFDELLIEVNPNFNGFNVIRGNSGIYEGRCYYIDLLNNSMQALYQFLTQQ